jgi:hypothetical protein
VSQTLEPINDANGRSIGCLLLRETSIIAITPNGETQLSLDRAHAIAWLHERAPAPDKKHVSRPPDVVELAVLGITILSLLFYLYLWVS